MTTAGGIYARRRVMFSVATLADIDYQQRVWVRLDLPTPRYYDELDAAIHALFDDYLVLPEPTPDDYQVLLPGDEIARLRQLGAVFDPVIDRLGDTAETDADYLADPEWPAVIGAAQRSLSALILAGGWEHTDTDAEAYAQERLDNRAATVDRPATRRRVIRAVAALADQEYQQRTWTDDAGDPVTGSLGACLHTLAEDAQVLPDPSAAIGRVLLHGDEIARLVALHEALRAASAVSPLAAWPGVVDAALQCLPALVIPGGWIGGDPVAPGATDREGSAGRE